MVTQLAKLEGHLSEVWSVAWKPSSLELTSCGGRTILHWFCDNQLWKLHSVVMNAAPKPDLPWGEEPRGGRELPTPVNQKIHSKTVRSVAWSHDGEFLASASFDTTAAVWSLDKSAGSGVWICRAKLEGHEHEVKRVAWDRSNKNIATCSRDRNVYIYTMVTAYEEAVSQSGTPDPPSEGLNIKYPIEFMCSAVLSGHSQDVKCVTWHPTIEGFIISGSYDNTIKMWMSWESQQAQKTKKNLSTPDPRAMTAISVLQQEAMTRLDESDNESNSDDGLTEWGSQVGSLSGHDSTVWDISFASGGEALVSCSDDETLRIWTKLPPPSLPPNLKIKVHPWLYLNPAIRSKARANLMSESNTTENLKDARDWNCAEVIRVGGSRTVYSCSWHPTLEGCGDNSIRFFGKSSTSSGSGVHWVEDECIKNPHDGRDVNCVCWSSSDEHLLASAGDDGSVRIFSKIYFLT